MSVLHCPAKGQVNTNPILGPLQDNGGPTFTHALLPGSPAVDAGDPNFTPATKSTPTLYLALCRTMEDRHSRTPCYRVAQPSTQAIRILLRRLITISAAPISGASAMVASTAAHLKCSKGRHQRPLPRRRRLQHQLEHLELLRLRGRVPRVHRAPRFHQWKRNALTRSQIQIYEKAN